MGELARSDADRLPAKPQPVVGREGASAMRAPAPMPGNGTAGGLSGRDGPSQLMALQRAAGNHAVAGLVGLGVVQRHPGPTTNAEVQDGSETEGAAEGPAEEAATPSGAETADESATGDEATSQPGTGTTGTGGTAPAALTGPARKTAIEAALAASDTGRWAQGIVDKWKIPVDYDYAGVGSFHQGGKIFINKTCGIGGAAMVMMHEAQHANTYKLGTQADRTTLSRAEFVKKSIADEAEATVRQVEGLAVTTGLGLDMGGNAVDEGLKQRYLKAFYAKRDELKAANPTMSTAEINATCRTFTRDGEVTKWFYDGTFVVSVETTPTSYGDFYGKQWDDVHKAPATP